MKLLQLFHPKNGWKGGLFVGALVSIPIILIHLSMGSGSILFLLVPLITAGFAWAFQLYVQGLAISDTDNDSS